jgi:hypothetical protein
LQFAYEGFKHNGNRRCFLFRPVEKPASENVYSIEVDLSLFSRHRVSVQEGPNFCLQILTRALVEGPLDLERFRSYEVVGTDFQPLIIEREKKDAEKALKVRARKPYQKPPQASNFRMDNQRVSLHKNAI